MRLKLDFARQKKPLDERDVYRLSRFGYTQAEIAEKLGISSVNFSRRLNKSLTLMQARNRGKREFEEKQKAA